MSKTQGVLAIFMFALVAGLVFQTSFADARGFRAGQNGLEDGYVTAYSRFNNGRITRPVRPTRLGPQVHLPSGHWMYCRRSCSETLRVETIDSPASTGNYDLPEAAHGFLRECGVFGCLDIRGRY